MAPSTGQYLMKRLSKRPLSEEEAVQTASLRREEGLCSTHWLVVGAAIESSYARFQRLKQRGASRYRERVIPDSR